MAPPPPGQGDRRWCEAPNPDEPSASPRSEPPPQPAFDADTTPASTTGPPDPPDPDPRNGAATHAQSAEQPHTGGQHQSPPPRPGPPTPPDTAAPQHPAPPTKKTSSQLREEDGTRRCHPRTEATVAHLPEPRPETVRHLPEPRPETVRHLPEHSVHHEPKPHITSSHNVSPRSPHSRSTDPPTCAVSPGHSVLTASFATRGSRVQIPSAPRFCLVLVGEILTARCRNDGRAGESAYSASTAVAR
jgi:hypothetical protein